MKDFRELFEKYQALLIENRALKKENELLKTRLGITAPVNPESQIDPLEKIRLFMSLFKGRDDVYARRWENNKGSSGYTPVCLNEWKSSICRKRFCLFYKLKPCKCYELSILNLTEAFVSPSIINTAI
jgi:hypothetical protein